MRRVGLIAVVAAAAATGIAGCANGSGPAAGSPAASSGKIEGEITLQTWSLSPKYTDYLNSVVAAFQQKYPGTKVNLVDQPGDGYSDKVLSQASSNTLPDVVNLPPDFALPLAKQGLLADVAKADADLNAQYVKGAVAAYRYPGLDGVYAFPWYLGTDVDYWNKSQLDSCGLSSANPPKTTQDLFDQAKTMHDHCPQNYLISKLPQLEDLVVAGVKILNNDDSKFTFATPEAAAVVDKYREAFQHGEMPPTVLNNDYLGNTKLFTQTKAAWTTGATSSMDDIVKNNPSMKDNVVISPALDTAPLYVQGVSVSQQSKHLAAAVAFAEFLTNADNQNTFGHKANVFPSSSASAGDPYYSQDDGTAVGKARVTGFATLKDARLLKPAVLSDAMTDAFKQQIGLALKGQLSSADALQKAQDKLNQLLAQEK